jgi:hypothetical protein
LVGNTGRMTGTPFLLAGATISRRKWCVCAGWLHCEAMGGWRPVVPARDGEELAARLAWLGIIRHARRTSAKALPAWLAVSTCVTLAGLFVAHQWMRRNYVEPLPDLSGE